jgi:hypothetical protein
MLREPRITTLGPLRARRTFRDKDLTIAEAVGSLTAETVRQARRVEGATEAWWRIVPRELAAGVAEVRMSRGVLTARMADTSVRFALDRFIRSGGERSLIEASRGKIKRVRLI